MDLVRGTFDFWVCSLGGGPGHLAARVQLGDIRAFLELGAPGLVLVPCFTGV